MQCPVCHVDQVIIEYQGVELDLCVDGHGVWFDADEIRQLFEAAGVPERLHDLETRLTVLPRERDGPKRRCPRCRGTLEHVQAPGGSDAVILDRCRRGHGLWFDDGELEAILSLGLDEDDDALADVRNFLGDFAAPQAASPGEEEA